MSKFFLVAVAAVLIGSTWSDAGRLVGRGGSCSNGSCAVGAGSRVAVTSTYQSAYRVQVVPLQAPPVAIEQPAEQAPPPEPLPPPRTDAPKPGVRVTAPGVNVEVVPPVRAAVPVGTVWAVPVAGYSRTTVVTETGDGVVVQAVGGGRVRGFFKRLFHRGG